ncbi:MAG: hypothetical protein K8R34_18210 [Methanosarcinales archaeon]|nr:hypothetical protein [Methanosarcinales archaeon]MCD4808832.1 hypothetical protein [Methanosarcinales archaeon]
MIPGTLTMVCGPGAGAHALKVGWGVVGLPLLSRRRPLCTYPCHRSPSGGSVAGSLVDSFEFRTADIAAKLDYI